MSKNISAPLIRTARLLDLVPYLNTHQGIALKELASHFDVTPAQMSADLTTLWMCGLPGYTPLELMDLEFESGFVSIRNAPTLSKPRSITFQEGVALLLGLDLIASSLPEARKDLLTAVVSLRQRLITILGVPIRLSVIPATSGVISASIAQSIASQTALIIEYQSMYKDQNSKRTVMPVELYEHNNNQYLRAYCFTALDYREFRVDRITTAEPTAETAPIGISKPSSEKFNFTITMTEPSRDVAERFALMQVAIGVPHTLASYSRQWIARSVMASGGAVRLDMPLDIRAEVAKKAQLMLDRYKAE
jgi:proteasome accessory factor C